MWVKCGQEFTLGQNSWNKLVKYLLSGSVGDMFCLFYLRHCSALAAHSKCLGCLSQNPALHTILQILNSAVGQLPNVFSWTGEFGKRRDTRVTYPSVCLCLIMCAMEIFFSLLFILKAGTFVCLPRSAAIVKVSLSLA